MQGDWVGVATALSPATVGHFKFLFHLLFVGLGLTLLARLIDDLAREFFNQAIDGVIQNNPKARANPKALAQLDGYKRPLVSPLSGSSAVWDGKSCEDRIASGNYR